MRDQIWHLSVLKQEYTIWHAVDEVIIKLTCFTLCSRVARFTRAVVRVHLVDASCVILAGVAAALENILT